MAPTITKQFSSVFDPMCEEHVMWLKALHENTQMDKDPMKLMVSNPFHIKIKKEDTIAWIDVMFALAMKYAMDVLAGKAFIPPIQATQQV